MSLLVDVLQYGTGSHPTTSEAANSLATDIVSDGIIGTISSTSGVAPTTGGFAVNTTGSANGSVTVTAGVAYVTGTPTSQGSQRLRVKLTANDTVALAANSTGGTRFDWIYIKLDPTNMANPNAAADNVATLVVSRSTSSSSDNGTPPTYGYCIAKVQVANGFTTGSTVSNGSITDARTQAGATASSYTTASIPTTTPVSTRSLTNPYKFHVRMAAATNTGNGTFSAAIPFDTEIFDTGNNVSAGVFTAPVAGFYFFSFQGQGTTSGAQQWILSLYKNGVRYLDGSTVTITSGAVGSTASGIIQLAANDTVDIRAFCGTARPISVGTGGDAAYFTGFLVSTS